jgi:hypothetical protein
MSDMMQQAFAQGAGVRMHQLWQLIHGFAGVSVLIWAMWMLVGLRAAHQNTDELLSALVRILTLLSFICAWFLLVQHYF